MKNAKRIKLAICVFGHGGSYQVWASGTDENIVLATKAARKAKRDYKIKKGFVMPVNLYDITDTEHWAYDGYTIVDPDNVAVIFKAVEFIAVTKPDKSLLGKSTDISTDVELSERLNV